MLTAKWVEGMSNDIDEGGFTLCEPKLLDCGRRYTCERIHFKGSRNGLATLDLSSKLNAEGDCPHYVPRPIIADQKYLFGSGKRRRHNAHAPAPIPSPLRFGKD
jgi:hypothetical protein